MATSSPLDFTSTFISMKLAGSNLTDEEFEKALELLNLLKVYSGRKTEKGEMLNYIVRADELCVFLDNVKARLQLPTADTMMELLARMQIVLAMLVPNVVATIYGLMQFFAEQVTIACLESLEMEGAKVEVGGLESSLFEIIQEHQQKAILIRDQAELLVDTVNGVEETFINEKLIELEIRALISTIMRYRKQTSQWLAASHAMNSLLKEIGDFENWMKTMDFDCKSINAAIRNIHQA